MEKITIMFADQRSQIFNTLYDKKRKKWLILDAFRCFGLTQILNSALLIFFNNTKHRLLNTAQKGDWRTDGQMKLIRYGLSETSARQSKKNITV